MHDYSYRESHRLNMVNCNRRATSLTDYEARRLIGIGTVAKVYSAIDRHTGEIFAIKIVDKNKICEDDKNKIDREITSMLWLRHPNIVRMYDVFETGKNIYLIMEYAGGAELWKIAGNVEEDVVRIYFQQLLSALDYCHTKGFIHRDLKLQNLLLDGDGNLKVSNFSLCALPSDVDQEGSVKRGFYGGSLQYTPPELLTSKDRFDGSKADLWACGIFLYVMLTGNFPFNTTDLPEFVESISNGGFECPECFPDEVTKLVSMLLEPNPRKRICLPMLQNVNWVRTGLSTEEGGDIQLLPSLSEDEEDELRFRTNLAASEITYGLEKIVCSWGFRVTKTDWLVKMEGPEIGRRGCLGVVIKFLELKPELVLAEMSKTIGQSVEFERFCEELKPCLKDYVWTGMFNKI